MTEHVDPAIMVALAEGNLAKAEEVSARAGIAACPHCARHFEDLTSLTTLVARSDGLAEERSAPRRALSPTLDHALEEVIRGHTAGRGMSRRTWFSIATAAAVIGFALLVVPTRDGSEPGAPLRGVAVFESAAGGLRGGPDETFHFDLEFAQSMHVAIFRVAGSKVDVVYPDPNSVLGTYGRTTPFGAAERARIPPSRLADLPASRSATRPAFFAVGSTSPIEAASLAAAREAAGTAISGGLPAVQAALAERFATVVSLDVR